MTTHEGLHLKEDLVPVSTLQAKTARVLREVGVAGRYKVITREGVAVAVIVGVDDFERLRQDAALGRLLREIQGAEAEIDGGEGVPQASMEQEFQVRWGQQA